MQALKLPEPKQSRSIETRRRLLDAAGKVVLDQGYAHVTTQDVVRRAGVSQGALFRYFPSKAALLAETFVHVSEQVLALFVARFRSIPRGTDDDVVRLGVETAWDVIHEPIAGVVLELLVATRTDAELRDAIEPAATQFYARIYSELFRLAPPQAAHPAAQSLVWLMLDVMLGRRMGNMTGGDPALNLQQRELLIRVVRRELAMDGAAAGGAPAPY